MTKNTRQSSPSQRAPEQTNSQRQTFDGVEYRFLSPPTNPPSVTLAPTGNPLLFTNSPPPNQPRPDTARPHLPFTSLVARNSSLQCSGPISLSRVRSSASPAFSPARHCSPQGILPSSSQQPRCSQCQCVHRLQCTLVISVFGPFTHGAGVTTGNGGAWTLCSAAVSIRLSSASVVTTPPDPSEEEGLCHMQKSSVGSQRLREQTQRRGERPLWAELPVGAHGQDPPKNRFLPIDKLDLDSFAKEKTGPGELALVKFLRMLDHICHRAPGKNLHFEPNADILRSVPRLFHSGRIGSGLSTVAVVSFLQATVRWELSRSERSSCSPSTRAGVPHIVRQSCHLASELSRSPILSQDWALVPSSKQSPVGWAHSPQEAHGKPSRCHRR